MIQSVIEDDRCVSHILLDLLTVFIVFFKDIVNAHRLAIVQFLKEAVFLSKIPLQALSENVFIQKVRDTDTNTRSLVHVGRTDSLDCRPDFIVTFCFFLQAIQLDMVRQDDMGTI